MQTSGAVDKLMLLFGTLVIRLYTSWRVQDNARASRLPLAFGPSLLDFGPSLDRS
jgi:hypothetical protein